LEFPRNTANEEIQLSERDFPDNNHSIFLMHPCHIMPNLPSRSLSENLKSRNKVLVQTRG
jgi:hypothetical protein